jgi:CheY-like chemotaxis protein
LVVDDEACMRAVLNLSLRQQGFAVWLAADGREALDLYRKRRWAIDVVVMDVRMPGLDGPQTLALLQQLNPRICCRFMSGDLGRYLEWKLSNLSSAAVIRKPFRLPEIAQMLWKLAPMVNGIKAVNLAPPPYENAMLKRLGSSLALPIEPRPPDRRLSG